MDPEGQSFDRYMDFALEEGASLRVAGQHAFMMNKAENSGLSFLAVRGNNNVKAVGGITKVLEGAIKSNYRRFVSKIPANSKSNSTFNRLKVGNYLFEATSSGKVSGSSASYQKWVNPQGETLKMIKQRLLLMEVLFTQNQNSDMRSRKKILRNLVLLQGNIKVLQKELAQYSWYIEKPVLKINVEDFTNILIKSINNEIDLDTLINWANTLECRDDLEFENVEMQEIIFELANPEINGEITKERLSEIITELIK